MLKETDKRLMETLESNDLLQTDFEQASILLANKRAELLQQKEETDRYVSVIRFIMMHGYKDTVIEALDHLDSRYRGDTFGRFRDIIDARSIFSDDEDCVSDIQEPDVYEINEGIEDVVEFMMGSPGEDEHRDRSNGYNR